MHKIMVGGFSLVFAVLLLAACGGSTTPRNAVGATSSTMQIAPTQQTTCASGYLEAAEKANAARELYVSQISSPFRSEVTEYMRTYAAALRDFNNDLSRLSCPESVKSDIRSAIEASSLLATSLTNIANGDTTGYDTISQAVAKGNAADIMIRAGLNLPPGP
jgi:hypothetical protein